MEKEEKELTLEELKAHLSNNSLPKPWTKKQVLFVLAYLGEAKCVALEAAKIAGYKESACKQIGHENLTKLNRKHIQDVIFKEMGTIMDQFDISIDGLLRRLGQIAMTDLTDVVEITDSGRMRLKAFDDIPEYARGALKSISDKSGNTDEVAVQLHDPIAAIEKLAKLQKMYSDNALVSHGDVHIYIPENNRPDRDPETGEFLPLDSELPT